MSQTDRDLMTRDRQRQLEARSPTLQALDREDAEMAQKARKGAQQRMPEWWSMTPAESVAADQPTEKAVTLTSSDDHLPFLAEVQNDVDLIQQQIDDDENGITRPPLTYANQYMRPNRRTVRGFDLGSGQRHYTRGNFDIPGVEHHTKRGVELLRQSTNNLQDGPDDTGLRGLAHIAAGIQLEGGDFNEYRNAIDMAGVSPEAAKLGWNAAMRSRAQQEIETAYMSPTSEPEVREAEAEPLPDLDADQLVNEAEWLQSAQTLWEAENAAPWTGTPSDLSDWALQEMANFNWKVVGDPAVNGSSMAYYSVQAALKGGEYAESLLSLINIYDRVRTDWGVVGRSALAAVTDPTLFAGLGFGKGAAYVTSRVAMSRMKRFLSQAALVGAGEGAVYAGGENVARQSVEVSAGAREAIDPAEAGKYAAAGAAVGGVLGPAAGAALSPAALAMYRRAGQKMLSNARAVAPRGPIGAQVGAVGDLTNIMLPGRESRISTRLPTAVDAPEDPLADNLVINMDVMEASPRGTFKKNTDFVREYDNYRPVKRDLTDRQVMERFKDHIVDNLLWLHDQMKPEVRARAKLWYDGARRQTEQWAGEYGLEPQQVAGVIASLSPQKDWFMNMSLAERMMDIWTQQQAHVADARMDKAIDKILWVDEKGKRKKSLSDKQQISADIWEKIKDSSLEDIPNRVPASDVDYARAMWIRAYDEAYNPRHHRIMSPEGTIMDYATTIGGERKGTGWGSFSEIGKAASVLADGTLENISRRMGEQHKVRNFYSNIISPDSDLGEVTIDTHAVAAALLKPLSGKGYEVGQNFGSSAVKGMPGGASSAITGAKGMYGVYADAYREAARQRGILPREMQSIVWEEVRTLFTDAFKTDENLDKINRIWRRYRNGRITQAKAREEIYELAGGTADPSWYRPGTGPDARPQRSTYREELPGTGVPGQGPGDTGGGRTGRTSRGGQTKVTEGGA